MGGRPSASAVSFTAAASSATYTLSLHGALPIFVGHRDRRLHDGVEAQRALGSGRLPRSEEHTSELQSRLHLVCRLLLEKKKTAPPSTAAYSTEARDRRSGARASRPTARWTARRF